MKKVFEEGYSFSEKRIFTEGELKKLAKDCGDMNLIHHDSNLAKATRFSGIIASGSAMSAIFSAMIPTHLSQFSPMLGLEMSFKFPKPIKANMDILMTWHITHVLNKPNAEQLMELAGEITDSEGSPLIIGAAKVILLPNYDNREKAQA